MSEFTADPYASPAPVFTVAGRTEDGLGRDLLRLDVREGVLGLRTMVAHFAATPPESDGSSAQLSYLDGQVIDLGSTLGVALGPPGPELTLVRGQLVALTVRADLAHQRPTVELRGWDHDAARAVSHVSDGAVVAAEVTSGRSGVDVVSKVFTKASLGRSRRDVLDQDTADAYADAEMLRRARAFVTADGTTAGTPDLVPGAKLELQDVGRPFEGAGYRVV